MSSKVFPLMCDPEVVDVDVVDRCERLVDARVLDLSVGSLKADPAGDFAFVRAGVAERLAVAQSLLPESTHLVLVEGYRPPSLQERYFAEYLAELQALDPTLAPDELHRLASRYVSPPSIAPHSTGGAVDVLLVDDNGAEVDMGTAINATPEESDGACYFDAPHIAAEAVEQRRQLAHVMTAAGFVNYPTEWWHWSFGDRYWAQQVRAPHALYGPIARSQ